MRDDQRDGASDGHAADEGVRREPVLFVRGARQFEVTLQFERDGNDVTGLCPELGIAAFGENDREAESALIEAVIMQVEAHDEAGDLEEFLSRNGIALKQSQRSHWTPVNPQLMPA